MSGKERREYDDSPSVLLNGCLQKHHRLDCRINTSREFEPCTVRSGARILAGTRYFSVLGNVQTGSEIHPAPYSMGGGVKQPGREVDRSPPSSVEVYQ